MTTALRQALAILEWAVGRLGTVLPVGPIAFDEPDPTAHEALLLGFDEATEPASRLCCAIGWQTSFGALPAISATRAMDLSTVGVDTHRYGGPRLSTSASTIISEDPVGHIYTRLGGLIDIGHARDHADLARYLAIRAHRERPTEGQVQLADEAGTRTVSFKLNGKPVTPRISALIGARASYDCAIWHEIVTWANGNPIAAQPYSAFSPEDNYSNLLGAYVGYRAMLSTKPFDRAVSEVLMDTLLKLGPANRQETLLAVLYVDDRWYRYTELEDLVLLRRHFDALGLVTPWLITDVERPGREETLETLRGALGRPPLATPIALPDDDPQAGPLDALYEFRVEPDDTIPSAFFDGRSNVTNADFPALIAKVRAEVLSRYPDGDEP